MRSHAPNSRSARVSRVMTNEEIAKFNKYAADLEMDQRKRFADHRDPYTFFESDFEQQILLDIDAYRRTADRALELKKDEEMPVCSDCGRRCSTD